MFSFNWLDSFLRKEAAEESQLAAQHEEANIIDSDAVGDKVRTAALDLYETEDGALLEMTWAPSSYKILSKQFPSLQDAQNVFNELKGQLLSINKMVLEGAMEQAAEMSKAIITAAKNVSSEPLQQTTNQPITQTQAARHPYSCTDCPFSTKDPKEAYRHGHPDNPETGGHNVMEDKEASTDKKADDPLAGTTFPDADALSRALSEAKQWLMEGNEDPDMDSLPTLQQQFGLSPAWAWEMIQAARHDMGMPPMSEGKPAAANASSKLQVSIILPAIDKEAKATVQNIFFSDVRELLEWQEAQKAAQPKPEGLPGGLPETPGAGPAMPPMGGAPMKGPLTETPAKPSALEQMVDQKVQEKVESSLDAKARATFENVHAETVKILRELGRSWEEIKDFFNRYLKYDWDDIDVYLDQFIQAEQGRTDPGTEKVKDELATDQEEAPPALKSRPGLIPAASKASTVEKKAEQDFKIYGVDWKDNMDPAEIVKLHNMGYTHMADIGGQGADAKFYIFTKEPVSYEQAEALFNSQIGLEDAAADVWSDAHETWGSLVSAKKLLDEQRQQSASLKKKAELVRYPDSLKEGDEVTLVRSIMTKENLILQPEVKGKIIHANEYSIVIESKFGRFTISKHDCNKLDKKASLDIKADQFQSIPAGHMYEDAPSMQEECMLCKGKGEDPVRGGPCPECTDMDLDAAMDLQAEKYYLDPTREYDWEADLVDEINQKFGPHKKAWDFTSEPWEVQYDESKDLPYVEVKLMGPASKRSLQEALYECSQCGSTFKKPEGTRSPCCQAPYREISDTPKQASEDAQWLRQEHPKERLQRQDGSTYVWEKEKPSQVPAPKMGSLVVHRLLGPVLVNASGEYTQIEDQEGNQYWVEPRDLKAANMSPEAYDFMSKHIQKHMDEGMKQDQAIAAAYEEARKEGYQIPEASTREAKLHPGSKYSEECYKNKCDNCTDKKCFCECHEQGMFAGGSLQVSAQGERLKIRELKDRLNKATKPADIKSLCDAIEALENRMDKDKDRKDKRREEKQKKSEPAPEAAAPKQADLAPNITIEVGDISDSEVAIKPRELPEGLKQEDKKKVEKQP